MHCGVVALLGRAFYIPSRTTTNIPTPTRVLPLGDVAGATRHEATVEGFRAVLWEEILIGVNWTVKSTPVIPIFREGVKHAVFVATAVAGFPVFFRQAIRDVVLRAGALRDVGAGVADRAE